MRDEIRKTRGFALEFPTRDELISCNVILSSLSLTHLMVGYIHIANIIWIRKAKL
jgi:hypothetical protein